MQQKYDEFLPPAAAFFLYLLMGALIFAETEPTITNFNDAYYFVVITLTTVGFGDFYPTTTFTRAFLIFYSIFGLAMVANVIAHLVETIQKTQSKVRPFLKTIPCLHRIFTAMSDEAVLLLKVLTGTLILFMMDICIFMMIE
jgi:quinol-cytochrome oxidoreductase complex cytochrome b subunit